MHGRERAALATQPQLDYIGGGEPGEPLDGFQTLGSSQERSMSDSPDIKDKVAVAAVTGAGATVGGAGGATVGVLELAARGVATGLSATVVIGAGAAAGAALAYGAYRSFRKRKPSRSQNTPGTAS
jgi:uncharacterized membrane protein YebE (DUF533 family)